MSDVRAIAAAYGVRVELADLGDWGTATLIAEYDPDGPVIRVNSRVLRRILRQGPNDMSAAQDDTLPAQADTLTADHDDMAARSWIDRAVAHELYHHREAIGEVPRLAGRAAREAAADAFAEQVTGMAGAFPAAVVHAAAAAGRGRR